MLKHHLCLRDRCLCLFVCNISLALYSHSASCNREGHSLYFLPSCQTKKCTTSLSSVIFLSTLLWPKTLSMEQKISTVILNLIIKCSVNILFQSCFYKINQIQKTCSTIRAIHFDIPNENERGPPSTLPRLLCFQEVLCTTGNSRPSWQIHQIRKSL